MLMRIALVALMAVGLVGFGATAWYSTRPSPAVAAARAQPLVPPPPLKVTVLVAAHPLRAGSLLKPDDLKSQERLIADTDPAATRDTPEARGRLYGSMIRRSLAEGEVVLPPDVMRPGDHGFLATVLAPGTVAASVGVDAISGTAGLIWPGDRVDVVLTQTLDNPNVPAGRRVAAETVLTGVRVIAIDQQLVQGASGGDAAASGQEARTVTLEVTPEQSEHLAVAERLGHLSLAVNATDRGGAPVQAAKTVTWGSDVSHAFASEQAQTPAAVLHIYQGTADAKDYHF